jgi:AraC-like DNA-binding protein
MSIVRALWAEQAHNARVTGRESALNEVVDYRRSAALPGVEVISAQRSPREWRVIPEAYAVVVFRTWRGRACTRGRVFVGEPGQAFCNTPGELLIGTPVAGPGSFDVLQVGSELLEAWLEEQQPGSVRPEWSAIMQPVSTKLHQHFSAFFRAFESQPADMHIQSLLLELSEVMISELVQGASQPCIVVDSPVRAALRMRECLNEEGLNVDLETLAKRAGLSRFHALRAFKQRYGLPPHAYQLCLRIHHARLLLADGASAADVALRCGFADQSHFTRHFKRFTGVTPMQYARARTPMMQRANDCLGRTRDGRAIVDRAER